MFLWMREYMAFLFWAYSGVKHKKYRCRIARNDFIKFYMSFLKLHLDKFIPICYNSDNENK